MDKIKEILNQIKDISKVLYVLITIGSIVVVAVAWLLVNVFYPESIAIEITKYFLIVLAPITISAIMLQLYRKRFERKMDLMEKKVAKITDLDAQVKTLSETTQQAHKNFADRLKMIHENLQYFNDIFTVSCPNCKKPITIHIPFNMVKEIHLVDGPPKGVFLQGREEQVICQACGQVYHIVYP